MIAEDLEASMGARKGPLVYKDAPDMDSSDDDEDDAMDNSDASEDMDMDDDDDSEEEIKEIPLKQLAEKSLKKKRAKVMDSDDMLYGAEEDDSGSDSDGEPGKYAPEPKKKNKKSPNQDDDEEEDSQND